MGQTFLGAAADVFKDLGPDFCPAQTHEVEPTNNSVARRDDQTALCALASFSLSTLAAAGGTCEHSQLGGSLIAGPARGCVRCKRPHRKLCSEWRAASVSSEPGWLLEAHLVRAVLLSRTFKSLGPKSGVRRKRRPSPTFFSGPGARPPPYPQYQGLPCSRP